MVQGKIRTVNHMKNVEIRSRRNPEDGPTRRSNHKVQIVIERSLKITSLRRILRAPNHDGRTNVKQIDAHKSQIITASNKLANLKHISSLRQTNQRTSSTYHRYVKRITETLKESRSRIRMHKHKLLRAQKPHTYAQAT